MSLLLLLLTAGSVSATCNFLKQTCPSVPGFQASQSWTFDGSSDFKSSFDITSTPANIQESGNGLSFSIKQVGDSPTIVSNNYLFFGKITFEAQAAPGAGIISSVILMSDDDDEIDLEWVGSDNTQVQTNYFGKGFTGTYNRGGFSSVQSPASSMHTYTIDWTEESITWSIDGTVVRVQTAAAADGQFPQTPAQIRIGNWCGGCPGNAEGTIQWAGGAPNWSEAPFVMYIKSLSVTPYNPAKSYSFSDMSGSQASVVLNGAGAASNSTNDDTTTAAVTTTTTAAATTTTAAHTTTAAITTHSDENPGQSVTEPTTHTTAVPSSTTKSTQVQTPSATPSPKLPQATSGGSSLKSGISLLSVLLAFFAW